ncbi:hypothetical protein, partial [Bacillus cereus group sp. BfR-BA-01393]|uniref:hypothetical protein n=1 Tax=Bacillus cereus group sp. BfR-BA-01393 TaxID=2920330 RepID=UPI001F5A27DA
MKMGLHGLHPWYYWVYMGYNRVTIGLQRVTNKVTNKKEDLVFSPGLLFYLFISIFQIEFIVLIVEICIIFKLKIFT